MERIDLQAGKKVYFASDFHLGVPDYKSSLQREKAIVKWLEEIRIDAQEIFLLGDVFDFWFEYRSAVPRGYVRLLGKIAEITDSGIPVRWFIGNHDMWIFDYIPKELGVRMHQDSHKVVIGNSNFFVAHGDGLGPGDYGYKFIKKVFRSKVCQWLFARFHPNLGIGMANFWSGRSKSVNAEKDKQFLGAEKEWLSIYSKEILRKEHFDYFIYGHRHLPMIIQLPENSKYYNLGDWISNFTYGEFDGKQMQLKVYGSGNPKIYTS